MSVIKKKPFIEKVYESLTDAQKTALQVQINASGNSIPHQIISGVEDGIHTYLLKLSDFLVLSCITIKTNSYSIALAYGDKQHISIYNLNIPQGTYVEVKDQYLTIEELRRIVFGTGGGGGTVTPELLNELTEGSEEVVVDLNQDQSKLRISLHAKKVKIAAPIGATSGTISDEQIAALQESENSYIELNGEKYYLMDNEHTPGSLGYSHLGYENNKFIRKNITITLSTKGWVLSVDEGSNSQTALYVEAKITGMDPDTGLITTNVTTPNIYQALKDAKSTTGQYPDVYGLLDCELLGIDNIEFKVTSYREESGLRIKLDADLIGLNVATGFVATIETIEFVFDVDGGTCEARVKSLEDNSVFLIKVREDSTSPTGYIVTTPNQFIQIQAAYNNTKKMPRVYCELEDFDGLKLEAVAGSINADDASFGFSFRSKEDNSSPAYNMSVSITMDATDQKVVFKEWEDSEGGGAPTYVIEVAFDDPELTVFNISSSNYAEEIKQYIENNGGKLPNIQMRLGIEGRNQSINGVKVFYDDVFMFITGYIFDYDRDVPQEIQVMVRCEYGHTGSTDGQEVFANFANRPSPLVIKVVDNDTIDGITVPKIDLQELDQAFNAFDNNRQVIIYWASHPAAGGVHKYALNAIFDEAHQRTVCFTLENGVSVIEDSSGGIVVRLNNYTVQTTEPVGDINDGLLHIVKLDAEPATYYNGYLYLIKE